MPPASNASTSRPSANSINSTAKLRACSLVKLKWLKKSAEPLVVRSLLGLTCVTCKQVIRSAAAPEPSLGQFVLRSGSLVRCVILWTLCAPLNVLLLICTYSIAPKCHLVNRKVGVPCRIRTYDLQLRRLLLYPAELRRRISGGSSAGLELGHPNRYERYGSNQLS